MPNFIWMSVTLCKTLKERQIMIHIFSCMQSKRIQAVVLIHGLLKIYINIILSKSNALYRKFGQEGFPAGVLPEEALEIRSRRSGGGYRDIILHLCVGLSGYLQSYRVRAVQDETATCDASRDEIFIRWAGGAPHCFSYCTRRVRHQVLNQKGCEFGLLE